MGMKLLSTPQGKSRREIDNAQEELRSQQLDELIRAKRKELNDLDLRVLAREAEYSSWDFEAEREKLENERASLARERKEYRKSLVPLEQKEKELDTVASALLKQKEQLDIRETDLDQTSEILQERLDLVSEREQNALALSQDIEGRSSNLVIQEEEFKKKETALVEIMRTHEIERRKDERDIAKQKSVLKGRDTVLKERERAVAQKEAGFEAREKRLLDRYQTLQRAITEKKLNDDPRLLGFTGTE